MRPPFFSVVIPAFNRSHSLRRAISSVQRQTWKDFELIVVDDASSENLAAVVEAFGTFSIKFLRLSRNVGGGAARNCGVNASHGSYIAFLDSDDEWHEKKLEIMANEIGRGASSERTLYFHQTRIRNGPVTRTRPLQGPSPDTSLAEFLLCSFGLIQSSTIVLPAKLAREIPFSPRRNFQDIDLCLRLHAEGVSFHFVRHCLSTWSLEPSVDRLSRSYTPEECRKWLGEIGGLMTIRAQRAFLATTGARWLIQEGRRREAARDILPAILHLDLKWAKALYMLRLLLVPQSLWTFLLRRSGLMTLARFGSGGLGG